MNILGVSLQFETSVQCESDMDVSLSGVTTLFSHLLPHPWLHPTGCTLYLSIYHYSTVTTI